MPKSPMWQAKSGTMYHRVAQWKGYYIGYTPLTEHGKVVRYRVRIECYNKTAEKLMPSLQEKLPFGPIKGGDHLSMEVNPQDLHKALARCLMRVAEATL